MLLRSSCFLNSLDVGNFNAILAYKFVPIIIPIHKLRVIKRSFLSKLSKWNQREFNDLRSTLKTVNCANGTHAKDFKLLFIGLLENYKKFKGKIILHLKDVHWALCNFLSALYPWTVRYLFRGKLSFRRKLL